MEFDESCLEWVLCFPGKTTMEYPVLSWNLPLSIRSYFIPIGLSVLPNRNRVSPLPKGIYIGDYGTLGRRQGSRGACTPQGNT